MNVHCASCGADLDAHRNRALIFSLIPHIARKLTLFMAISQTPKCNLDTVTVAGIYDLRRLQIKRCGRLGPRTVLALDCCPSLLLFFHVLMNSCQGYLDLPNFTDIPVRHFLHISYRRTYILIRNATPDIVYRSS